MTESALIKTAIYATGWIIVHTWPPVPCIAATVYVWIKVLKVCEMAHIWHQHSFISEFWEIYLMCHHLGVSEREINKERGEIDAPNTLHNRNGMIKKRNDT